jgi:hypothetical protein
MDKRPFRHFGPTNGLLSSNHGFFPITAVKRACWKLHGDGPVRRANFQRALQACQRASARGRTLKTAGPSNVLPSTKTEKSRALAEQQTATRRLLCLGIRWVGPRCGRRIAKQNTLKTYVR